ncbi:hypothetical protein [Aquimarina algicola]|uniref:Bacteriocin n=1 Tax=Aquimarina algicola TaxID=2589995 RepID=A0A504J4S5_9FLAO|nr:hypothetical protein [Aquimarina algicola]TPN81700.1 hypothetical protein FHK87_24180 [Aquimarina algicola]
MKLSKKMGRLHYRRLSRNETKNILGGHTKNNCFDIIDACQIQCASPSRPEFFACYIPCLRNGGCYNG